MPRQPVLARQQLRRADLDVRRPATAAGRLIRPRHASTRRTRPRRGRLRRHLGRRLQQAQPRHGEPGGRRQRLEKRDVDPAHRPIVETSSHHEKPDQLGSRTGNRHDRVGRRLHHPRRLLGRQQREDRRRVARMHPQRSAGCLQHVNDRRSRGQGWHPGVRGPEAAADGLGARRRQQGGRRAAAAPDRSRHRPAHRRELSRLPQHRGGRGEQAPLVRRLGIDPCVQAGEDLLTAGEQQQRDRRRHEHQLRQRVRQDRAQRLLAIPRRQPPQGRPQRRRRQPESAPAHQQPPARRPDRLARVRHPHREDRVPEQDHPGEAHRLHQPQDRARVVVRQPEPGREHLDEVVNRRHAHPHQQPEAEQDDTPHLGGRRRVRAQGDDHHRGER